MRQLFLEKGLITVKQVSEPLLDDRAVLVRVHYSYISAGTETATIAAQEKGLLSGWQQKWAKVKQTLETHGYQGTKAIIKEKLAGTLQPLGYSCSGQVVAVGKLVTTLSVGDFVACAGSSANHADLVCVPEMLAVKIQEKDLKHASITTVGAIALQGIRRAQLQLGETVCVFGLGLLGQLTVQLAKLAGCRVIGVDLIPERQELAKSLGAEIVPDISYATNHLGVDATIITAASSSSALLQQAIEMTRKKGKVVIVGDVGLHLQRSPLYEKEIDVLISCSYGPGRYDTWYEQYGKDYPYAYVRWTEQRNMQAIVELIAQGELNIDTLSTTVKLDDAPNSYADLSNKKVLGVIIDFEAVVDSIHFASQNTHHERLSPVRPDGAKRVEGNERIRVGIVGCGGFARMKLLPIIASLKNTQITAVVDRDIPNADKVQKVYGAARVLTDDAELFAEDLVDAVVISSPHKFHAAQLERALAAGKSVFVEKPLVTDFEQLARVRELVQNNPQLPLVVDFNRPFSPFMQKIKRTIANRTGPLVVQYRMSNGYTPPEHWTQTEVGGGQIIGQACHIFDLFCFLTDAKPVSISVEATGDNSVSTIKFSDGSVCSLLFTCIGNSGVGKEYMELHYDGRTIVMDDFLELRGFGIKNFDEKASAQDKGHQELVTRFFGAVREHKPMPIGIEYLLMVSELTLQVDQLARVGGGEFHV